MLIYIAAIDSNEDNTIEFLDIFESNLTIICTFVNYNLLALH